MIKSVVFNKSKSNDYPFNLSFFNNKKISFDNKINIIVGDNGSGKSSFIEILQSKLNLYRIEKENAIRKRKQSNLNDASNYINIEYKLKKPRGFFFSAEDFTSYIHYLVETKEYSYREIDNINKEYKDRSDYSKKLASMPHKRTISEIDNLYSKDLLKSSHGEAYLNFFSSRLKQNNLYILDEPETPLSIQNQLALLILIKEAVEKNCQFIIVTHSPIMMAFPGASIFNLDNKGLEKIKYEDIEYVNLLKNFLDNPNRYFNHLFRNKKDS